MSKAPSRIGLTDAQTSELLRLKHRYQSHYISEPEGWLGNELIGYLGLLAISAACENQGFKRIAERSTKLRRKSMRGFEACLRRQPSAEDLLGELSRAVAVPGFLAEVIKKDVRLLVNGE